MLLPAAGSGPWVSANRVLMTCPSCLLPKLKCSEATTIGTLAAAPKASKGESSFSTVLVMVRDSQRPPPGAVF